MTNALPLSPVKPLVAIAADRVERYGHQAHALLHGYVDAVVSVSGGMALALPADEAAIDIASLIAHVDGVVLTGSPSNVSPHQYGQTSIAPGAMLDLDRDATVLPLIKMLVAEGVPVLGICRGFQEMNVAWGGTLNAAVHERPGAIDHREGDQTRPIKDWYEDCHSIEIISGGILSVLSAEKYVLVNSLHHQGVERLGQGLKVEAIAPDGLIEAFSVEGAPGFALAVQWHPEMRVEDSDLARGIFEAFGAACRQRAIIRAQSCKASQ
ncbi:gamma-glutamyl-gamma-aminobutyrate hydrolase family protein [Pseudomonas sp. PDM31]|uniref:gamma-glutamyl-gamma-aminobutyrate hydrolase family protein n=1 Tax=Pseudomonas sp. PDM31 TaxID=2854778 RepID=UPI001C47FC1E|nr:gamma-glutamyl-gamma-aminobutyrate hydrolase family protein [Pseudomonas sp. PDM31]MBV7476201.1 gamma-glutamyl-gamma-aminobutyrate hydrolase family protein [Pseudomonas sp. PDM31]